MEGLKEVQCNINKMINNINLNSKTKEDLEKLRLLNSLQNGIQNFKSKLA